MGLPDGHRVARLSHVAWTAVVLSGCQGRDVRPPVDYPPADYAAAAPADSAPPLVGANYTHHSFARCEWAGTGILTTYDEPGVADTVHEQMRRMRASGIVSLRLIVWHMRDVVRQHWGVVPSRGGRIPEPFRSNLVGYLTEARRFGFRRLTLSFSPQWANSPLRDDYDPGRFDENWAFIEDVRALALRYGPPEVHFDLLNEGGVSDYEPESRHRRIATYVGRMWRQWVEAHGRDDATVSVIAPERPRDRGHRLENLVTELGSGREPLPTWFELHLNYPASEVAWGLHYADSVLTAKGLDQPLIVGETSYDDASVAMAIGDFMATSSRPVDEVIEWFKRAGADCEISPPYQAGAYLRLRK